ncbi:MAG: DMT family transporter [Desulfobacterium sp.]|jgi:drug/metabolite transporter (DMT)-like permease|nr:DMT family transporter [Desulfobacterium sp.]
MGREVVKNLRPLVAGVLVVLIWSGWITISRYGVHTRLTPADITLLRYATTFFLVSPFIVRYSWKKFPVYQYLVVGLGVGFPYTMFSFYGLMEIRAAHAGVIVNGMLPVFGAAAAWIFFKQRISGVRYGVIGVIFMANIVMTGESSTGENFFSSDHIFGIFLLLSAALMYTFHMVGVRLWGFTWKDVIVVIPVVNGLFFFPLWFFFPSTNFDAPMGEILLQAAYQGIVVNIVALSCVAYAIRHLGTITVSLFMSFVPVTTAILAFLLLNESPSIWEITGILGCTGGLFLWNLTMPR